MSKGPQISDERKALYYVGGGVMALGFLLFLSNFFMVGMNVSMQGFAFRGVGGIVLIIGGQFIRSIGARGAAGSGLILDPRQAREDLKPWAQTAGGLVKDALDEVRAEDGAQPVAEVVKIRCPQCRTLNDEDAKFCKSCGGSL